LKGRGFRHEKFDESKFNPRRELAMRQFQPHVENLESKNLMGGGGGVTLSGGLLSIVAPMQSGNTAAVFRDATNGNVKVILDGTVQEFDSSQVIAIYYAGGMGGHDTFANATDIMSIDYGFGGNNTFVGGSGQDFFFVFGDGNLAVDAGGGAVAYTHGGHDTIIGEGILVF
jgi:hypothetical protein